MKFRKTTLIKSFIWVGVFALPLFIMILVMDLSGKTAPLSMLFALLPAAFLSYFLMRRKTDNYPLQFLICAPGCVAAAFGGAQWLFRIDFSGTGGLSILAYCILLKIFFFALFGIDLVFLIVRRVCSGMKERELREMAMGALETASNADH